MIAEAFARDRKKRAPKPARDEREGGEDDPDGLDEGWFPFGKGPKETGKLPEAPARKVWDMTKGPPPPRGGGGGGGGGSGGSPGTDPLYGHEEL